MQPHPCGHSLLPGAWHRHSSSAIPSTALPPEQPHATPVRPLPAQSAAPAGLPGQQLRQISEPAPTAAQHQPHSGRACSVSSARSAARSASGTDERSRYLGAAPTTCSQEGRGSPVRHGRCSCQHQVCARCTGHTAPTGAPVAAPTWPRRQCASGATHCARNLARRDLQPHSVLSVLRAQHQHTRPKLVGSMMSPAWRSCVQAPPAQPCPRRRARFQELPAPRCAPG